MAYKVIYEDNSIQIVDDGILLIDIFKNIKGTFTIDTVGEVCIDLNEENARYLVELLTREIEEE